MFDVGCQTFTIMSLKVSVKWLKDHNEMVLVFRKKSQRLHYHRHDSALTWQHHFYSVFAVIKPDKNTDITNA